MLGWRVLNSGEYRIDLPNLSDQEKRLVSKSYEHAKDIARIESDNKKMILSSVKKSAEEEGFYLNENQLEYLTKFAFINICGFGFLEQLINDNEIEEISIIGPNKPAYVYIRKSGWKSVNACFETSEDISDAINKMSKKLGRHITSQNPRLDAVLPDGSRLHASLPPISNGEITIRKFRQTPFSPNELIEIVSLDMMALLSMVMQCDFSVLIAGNTASGKTTTMNALFSFVPFDERILITEETPEINIPHAQQLRLIANRGMQISLKDLVYDSLRMRPDRIVVGEIRNQEEAEALFDVLLAGQARGTYATFHAQSAEEAIARLGAFGIRKDDIRNIDCIIIQRRMLEYDSDKKESKERRKIVEVAEVFNGKINIIYKNAKINLNGSRLLDKICTQFKIDRKKFDEELENRKKLIKDAPAEYGLFYSKIQKELFGLGGPDV